MKRVVVTGMGAITPIGNSVDEFWAAVKKQTVGIGEITKMDATDYKVKLAAEVKGFDAREHMDAKTARRMEAFCHYAVGGYRRGAEGFRTGSAAGGSLSCGRQHRFRHRQSADH